MFRFVFAQRDQGRETRDREMTKWKRERKREERDRENDRKEEERERLGAEPG